jgi:glycosyltransferase involved in cell wall biosynthesis
LNPQEHILSICIASYGDDVQQLLRSLCDSKNKGLPDSWSIEIIIADQFQSAHSDAGRWEVEFDCTYIHNPLKLGRSINRNDLGHKAKGDYLLFLDADALPTNLTFLQDYCKSAAMAAVIVGGTAYKPNYKSDKLRVKVGKVKEENSAKERERYPYGSFSAFNFLIRREVFLELLFNEDVTEYGHEDTLFGLELKYRNIAIKHIDNPAYHMGIDENHVFMHKTTVAIDGLAKLIMAGKIDEDIKLFRAYRTAQRSGAHHLLRLLNRLLGKPLKNALSSGYLPVFFYDVYKFMRLCGHPIKIGRRMP